MLRYAKVLQDLKVRNQKHCNDIVFMAIGFSHYLKIKLKYIVFITLFQNHF